MNFLGGLAKHRKSKYICLLIIIIISMGMMFYLGFVNKPILNGDELCSFISANQSTGNRLKFWSRSWYDGRLYLDAFSVHPGEEFVYDKVWLNQADDAHPPLWYAAIHTVSSFFPGQFSKWFSLVVNIICIPLEILLIYSIMKLLSNKNERLALLTAFLFGISTGTIQIILFLRMYTFLQTWCLLILFLHLRNVKQEKLRWYDFVLIGAVTLLGVMTHYFFLAFLFILAVCFCINLLKYKRIKETILYCVTMVITAGLSIVIYPAMLKHIFGGYRGTETIGNLTGNMEGFIESFETVTKAVLSSIFGNAVIGIVILGLILIIVLGMNIYTQITKSRGNTGNEMTQEHYEEEELRHREQSTCIFITLITLVVYYFLIVKVTPIIDFRYFAPIYPIIIMITVLGSNYILQKVIPSRNIVYVVLLLIGMMPTVLYIICDTPIEPTEAAVISDEYKDCDAILALHDPGDGITNYITLSNYYQMSKYSKFYIIYETELDPLEDETLKNEEKLIVTIYNAVDKDTIMNYLKDYTGLSREKYLYCGDEGDTETYLLER